MSVNGCELPRIKKTIDSVSFSDMSEKDFQDSLACEQISRICPMHPQKDFQDFQDLDRPRAGGITGKKHPQEPRAREREITASPFSAGKKHFAVQYSDFFTIFVVPYNQYQRE